MGSSKPPLPFNTFLSQAVDTRQAHHSINLIGTRRVPSQSIDFCPPLIRLPRQPHVFFGTVKAETYLYHFSSLALDSRCHFSKNYPTVWRIPVHKLLSRQPRTLRLLLYDHHVTMR